MGIPSLLPPNIKRIYDFGSGDSFAQRQNVKTETKFRHLLTMYYIRRVPLITQYEIRNPPSNALPLPWGEGASEAGTG